MHSAVRGCLHAFRRANDVALHSPILYFPIHLKAIAIAINFTADRYLGSSANLATDAQNLQQKPTDAVAKLYKQIVENVQAKTLPPTSVRVSLLRACHNRADIKLAFDALDKLRTCKTARQRDWQNWKESVSLALVAACVRSNAPDQALKTLSRRNRYGITPCISSAHYLLRYAQIQKDMTFARDVLQAMRNNSIEPHAKTADIVFRICAETKDWQMLGYHARKFLNDGVKFNRDAFDTWISLEANIGNTQEVWKIQELRLLSNYKHTVYSTVACAKAHLLKWEPQEAAQLILACSKENASSESGMMMLSRELEHMVDVWPAEVIAMRDKTQRKVLGGELKACLAMMFNYLEGKGLKFSVDVEDRYCSKNSTLLDQMLA